MTELPSSGSHDEEHWISISDLMAGLMMIFMFIAIAYIRPIVTIAESYQSNRNDIYEALEREFKDDLKKWNAELDKGELSFRFKSPDVLFAPAKAELKEEFKKILVEFYPRYIALLHQYKESITSVRIEGHTSSDWGESSRDFSYFKNMELSQARTREVLRFCLLLENVRQYKDWAISNMTANGLSFSQLRLTDDGKEDKIASRRVEFKIQTNADEKIMEILDAQKLNGRDGGK